jgi:hypothetical protein
LQRADDGLEKTSYQVFVRRVEAKLAYIRLPQKYVELGVSLCSKDFSRHHFVLQVFPKSNVTFAEIATALEKVKIEIPMVHSVIATDMDVFSERLFDLQDADGAQKTLAPLVSTCIVERLQVCIMDALYDGLAMQIRKWSNGVLPSDVGEMMKIIQDTEEFEVFRNKDFQVTPDTDLDLQIMRAVWEILRPINSIIGVICNEGGTGADVYVSGTGAHAYIWMSLLCKKLNKVKFVIGGQGSKKYKALLESLLKSAQEQAMELRDEMRRHKFQIMLFPTLQFGQPAEDTNEAKLELEEKMPTQKFHDGGVADSEVMELFGKFMKPGEQDARMDIIETYLRKLSSDMAQQKVKSCHEWWARLDEYPVLAPFAKDAINNLVICPKIKTVPILSSTAQGVSDPQVAAESIRFGTIVTKKRKRDSDGH